MPDRAAATVREPFCCWVESSNLLFFATVQSATAGNSMQRTAERWLTATSKSKYRPSPNTLIRRHNGYLSNTLLALAHANMKKGDKPLVNKRQPNVCLQLPLQRNLQSYRFWHTW